jgi:hypothetical protein
MMLISIKSFEETMASPSTEKMPETQQAIISIGECSENLKYLF